MIKLLAGVLLVSTLFMGCDTDDGGITNKKNYLKIGDSEYELFAGVLVNEGRDEHNNGYYGFLTGLFLYSAGISIGDDWFSGKGHLIELYMFSTSGNTLDNGDYIYSDSEPYQIGTFPEAVYYINIDFESEDYGTSEYITSGKVSVSKKGNEYSITINCSDSNGEKITGFYKGTLKYFEDL